MIALAALALALATDSVPIAGVADEPGAVRHQQLQLHQALGLATLGGLALTGGVGKWLDFQRESGAGASVTSPLQAAHQALGLGTGAIYLGAAGLALLAPPSPYPPSHDGIDSVALHRGMALLHGTTLAATLGLGLLAAQTDPVYRPYHQALGAVTFGLLGTAAAIIALDF